MLNQRRSFRMVVLLLLAAVVPCCSNFHALLAACFGGHHHDVDCGYVAATAREIELNGHDHGGDCPPDAAQPGEPHHESDCSCGKHDSRMLVGSKPSVEPLASVVIKLPNRDRRLRAQIVFKKHDVWATARPPTSLLRLHCALVV